jgi:heterodisulfide reductase subunit C
VLLSNDPCNKELPMQTTLSSDLANQIRRQCGENVFLCYQCQKCSSGCPVAEYFDLAPKSGLNKHIIDPGAIIGKIEQEKGSLWQETLPAKH